MCCPLLQGGLTGAGVIRVENITIVSIIIQRPEIISSHQITDTILNAVDHVFHMHIRELYITVSMIHNYIMKQITHGIQSLISTIILYAEIPDGVEMIRHFTIHIEIVECNKETSL